MTCGTCERPVTACPEAGRHRGFCRGYVHEEDGWHVCDPSAFPLRAAEPAEAAR